MPDKLLSDYKVYCKKNGYKVSARVAILIKKDMDNG